MNDNDKSTEWENICAWLQSLNYAHYASLFKSGGYDLWEIIFDLSANDLREIGIKPGHSKRIQKAIATKKKESSKSGNSSSPKVNVSNATITSIHSTSSNHNVSKSVSPKTNNCVQTMTTTTTKNGASSINKSTNSNTKSAQLQILPLTSTTTTTTTNTNLNSMATLPQIQQLQALQLEERKRKIRERFQQNAFFAGGIKNKLFETMTRVLNGLQQELIQYNGKFAEPINEMNQRIVALQRLDVHNLDGVWDSNDGLFEPMMRNIKEIKKFNHSMWTKINEFHALADAQLKNATRSLQQQINVINNMKTQYLIKQQHINALKRQFAINQNAKLQQRQPPLNTILTTTTNQMHHHHHINNSNNKEPSPGAMIANFQVTNVYNTNTTNTNTTSSPNTKQMKKTKKTKKHKKKSSKKHRKKDHSAPLLTPSPGRKPAYTSGELQMMKTYDKKKQSVADIIELQRRMQSIYGIPRSAYGIAQKMYRMGVLSATLPKKLQALQDKDDADKIKIGDGQTKNSKNDESSSESYYSSNDGDYSSSESDSDDDDLSSNSNSDLDNTKQQKMPFIIAQQSPSSNNNTMPINALFGSMNGYNQSASTQVPQRKPPSTNLRRYTVEEVNEIRKLIEIAPNQEAKVLFAKFRKKFPCWNDDTEAYTKFYQKKWRICKEQQTAQQKKRKTMQQQQQLLAHQPPFKKYKIDQNNVANNNNLPPPLINNPKQENVTNGGIAFNAAIMPKLPFVETSRNHTNNVSLKQEKDAFVVGNAAINPLSLPIIPNQSTNHHPLIAANVTPLNNQIVVAANNAMEIEKNSSSNGNSETVKNEILPPALPPPPGNK